MRILQVGGGATGSILLSFLIPYIKNHSLTLMDGDIVEEKNLLNQKYTAKDVGKNKAEVLISKYKKFYREKDLTFFPEYLTRLEQIEKVYPDIIIGCVDNVYTRKILHEYFMKKTGNLVYIDAGNGDIERNGQVVTGVKVNGVVTKPPVLDVFPEMKNIDDQISVPSCERTIIEHPQHVTTNVFAATTIFGILVNMLDFGVKPPHVARFSAEKIKMG